MTKMKEVFSTYSRLYRDTLLNDVIPFWEKYSLDWESGGYFTCLDRNGDVFDTDKFSWPQARQVWTFSMLFNQLDKKDSWLNISKNGVEFIRNYVMRGDGNFYFSVTKEGKPLVQPYNIFSDCFGALAFGQYGLATRDEEYLDLAKRTYQGILAKMDNPKGKYEKTTGNRPVKGFALPMILSNIAMDLENVLDKLEVERTIENCREEIMGQFVDQDSNLVYEFLTPDGRNLDTFEGRLLNPGHGIEGMWFMMDIASRSSDSELIEKCINVTINILEYSWDPECGGIFYFLDSKGAPPQQLEWDQKLWWVHLEALVALSKAYHLRKDPKVWEWYEKVHQYTWAHFPDAEYGEWFGYLSRQGEPLLTLKGGKWKGCFHLPRALFQCWKTFEALESASDGT